MMSDSLLSTLKKLRLSGLAESLEIRLHEACRPGGRFGILWRFFAGRQPVALASDLNHLRVEKTRK